MNQAASTPKFSDFVPKQRFAAIALSPDATQVAYADDSTGRFNLRIRTIADQTVRQLTDFAESAVRQVAWSPDGTALAFIADHHGDESYQVYLVPATGGEAHRITTADDRQHVLAAEPFSPDGRYLIYSGNDKDESVQDVIVHDLRADKVAGRWSPPEGVRFGPAAVSPDGHTLAVAGYASNTNCGCYLIDITDPDTSPRCLRDPADGFFETAAWASPTVLYVVTDTWGEFTALARYDTETDQLTQVAAPNCDVEIVSATPDGRTVAWTVNHSGQSVLHARTDGADIAVPDLPPAVVKALSLSRDAHSAVTLIDTATRPAELAQLDLTAGTYRYLTDSRPTGLRAIQPITPELITYPSAGGRQVPAWLYKPRGEGPYPVLLSIHGGPEYQERPTYASSGLYQYLLANGIGILAPNFAGSTGYGTAWQRLIHRDWGGADLDDFTAATDYLTTLDWTNPKRIGAMGGSYGGYATLTCLARLPDRFAAGVSICGPSNLVTLAKASPPTWAAFIRQVLGDPNDPTDAERLRASSPVSHADNITAPLMIIQGAQDPRVPQTESDQIVAALRDRGIEVRYDIYPDEGHGFTNHTNEIRALTDAAGFLVEHLH